MKKLFGSAIVALVLFQIVSIHGFENTHWEEVFFKANQDYKEGRFEEAVIGYEKLSKSGYENGHIYYNLGNTCFKLGRLGMAILNYERASLLLPRDPDLNFNLRHTRDQLQDVIPETEGFFSITFKWLKSFNISEVFWCFAALNILFWLLLFVKMFVRSEWTYYAFLALLILWLLSGTSFAAKVFQIHTDDRAIVLKKEVSILAGPDSHDTLLFKLHEGTMVRHERSDVGWSLIRLPDGRRGWTEAESVEKIRK